VNGRLLSLLACLLVFPLSAQAGPRKSPMADVHSVTVSDRLVEAGTLGRC
jgi:hypothetical protein